MSGGVILSIREKFGYVIFIFLALALVAFLLMAAFDSNSSLLRGRGSYDSVGSIDGEKITFEEYNLSVNEANQNYSLNTNGSAPDENTAFMLKQQAWNKIITNHLYENVYEELDVVVTNKELLDMVQGSNPHPAVRQSFSNPNTGEFNRDKVIEFITNIDQDVTGKTRLQWLAFEKYIKEDRYKTKYLSLVKKSFYVPTWQAEQDFLASKTSFDFSYVYFPYNEVNDADVSVTDAELEKYLGSNQNKYQQEESRSIEFVSFDIEPNRQDTVETLQWVEEKKVRFKETTNDTTFLRTYSSKPFDGSYKTLSQLSSSIKDTFFKIDTGVIVGPYYEGSDIVLAKLIDRKLIPDSVKYSQIVFTATTQEEYELKRRQADSLKISIEKGADFSQLALQYSVDNTSKFNGGDAGWAKPGNVEPKLEEKLFYQSKKGSVFTHEQLEASMARILVVQVTDTKQSQSGVKVAFLHRTIQAGNATVKSIYAKASEFSATHNTATLFKQAETDFNIRKAENIKPDDNTVLGLGSAREIVKWVYTAKQGDVSPVLQTGNKYVIALLTSVKEKGTAKLEDVRGEVELEVKKQKKAEILAAKINPELSIADIANGNGKEVRTASGVSFSNPFITGVGLEGKVAGSAFKLNPSDKSGIIKGTNGVFVIELSAKNSDPMPEDLTVQKTMISSQKATSVDQLLEESLKKNVEIIDNRSKISGFDF